MMAGAHSVLSLTLEARLVGSADLGNPVAPVALEKIIRTIGGTDALGKTDILWADTRTLAASANENIDLVGTALPGLLGGSIAAAEITHIILLADDANVNDVVAFGGSNAFNGPLSGTTPKITLGPSDVFLCTNRKGWAVTASTGDNILIANSGSGTAVTYTIVILGRTAAA